MRVIFPIVGYWRRENGLHSVSVIRNTIEDISNSKNKEGNLETSTHLLILIDCLQIKQTNKPYNNQPPQEHSLRSPEFHSLDILCVRQQSAWFSVKRS